MKKVFFALMCTVFSFGAVYAQTLTNQEVSNIISMSKEANVRNGVINPNLIKQGQTLTFLFTNGVQKTIVVESGDNQWMILKKKLAALVRDNGAIVPNISDQDNIAETDHTTPTSPAENTLNGIYSWILGLPWSIILIVFGIFFGLYLLLKFFDFKNFKRNIEMNSNSVRNSAATDHPMMAGGVSPSNAASYMDRVAARANVTRFGPITEGRLTTFYKVRVMFANGGRRQRINNELVHHSRARRNNDGTECDIFYKQVCGNDACQIDMSRASFVHTDVQPEVFRQQETPVATSETPNASATDDIRWESLAFIVAAMAAPMNNKDNGKLEVKVGQVEMKMEFSSSAKIQNLLLNGKAANEETLASESIKK